jgi:lipoprotein-releasing system permease protein
MQKFLSLFIAFRYTRAKKRNGFISFISLASMVGIALGVMVLITVLSVMNGFDEHIRKGIFSLAPQVTISGVDNKLSHWQHVQQIVNKQPNIVATAPFVSGEGILRSGDTVQPSLVTGINPQEEAKLTQLSKVMTLGKLSNLKKGEFGIVLGDTLADNLGAILGSKVTLITPQVSVTPVGVTPRFKRFTVVGIFHTGNGFGFDSRFAYINLHDAQAMFLMGNAVTGINAKLPDPYMALTVSHQLLRSLPNAYVSNWTLRYGPFFKAIALEKTMMFLILLLIVAVAAFNLVSTLVMVVNDKQSDIAILRTLGATPGLIMRIFMLQGMLVGFVGTFIGLVLGVLLALNVTVIVNFIQHVFGVQLFQSSVYFVAYLPSKLQMSDVLQICVIALSLCLLATIYPAWRASRTQPAEALRYE